MSESSPSRFNVTTQQLLSVLKQDEIEGMSCSKLADYFGKVALEKQKAKDSSGEAAFSLLMIVCHFLPNFDFKGNPFGPWWHNLSGPGSRSLMAEDLSEEDIDALEGLVPNIQNPDLRARVADVVWECRKKSFLVGQAAVHAYIEAANRLDCQGRENSRCVQSLERAAQVAGKLGFQGVLHSQVLKIIAEKVHALPVSSQSARICGELISILLRHKAVNTDSYAVMAEGLAKALQAEGFHDLAEQFWKLAAQIYRTVKNEPDTLRCQLNAAEALVAVAQKGAESPHLGVSYMAGWMQRALEALRQAKASPDRIKEVHRQLLELQSQTLAEIKPMKLDVNQVPGFSEMRKKAHEDVCAQLQNLSLRDAIAFLATQISPTNYQEHMDKTRGDLGSNVWEGLFSTVQLDHSGKVAERMETTAFGNLNDEALKQKMLQIARESMWPVTVDFWIEPAREAIVRAHNVRLHDLTFLVINNPFVREGREGLYLRGIQAGFYGDWALSTHFLIPQLEDSVRRVLQLRGGVTSTLESGVQDERDLNQILWMDEAVEAFGLDILFDLRGILIERFGYNLRNEMAHGLLDEGGFYGVGSVYLWWLTIMLCWRGHCIACSINEEPQAE